MSFRDELTSLIGPLKLAAIDAYMTLIGFHSTDTEYRCTKPAASIFDEPEKHVVTRPDQNGEGGGDYRILYRRDGGSHYVDEFAEIRETLDGMLAPWLTLPDTGQVDELLESLQKVTDILAPDGADGGGGVGVESEISEIERHLHSLEGASFSTYKTNFLGVLDSTSTNIYMLVANSIAAVAGSKGCIEGAQESVLECVRNATSAFKQEPGPTQVIQVIARANKLIESFLPAQAKAISEAGGAVFELLSKLQEEPDSTVTELGTGYNQVMGALPGLLTDINNDLATAESEIISHGNAAAKSTLPKTTRPNSDTLSNFDLSVPSLSPDSGNLNYSSVTIDEVALEAIYRVYMPSISSYLSEAAKDTEEGFITGQFDRDASLGAGAIGTTGGVNVMTIYAGDYLSDLAWETDFACEQLRLVHEDFKNQDDSSADALRQHERSINENPYDSYDEYI